MNREEFLEKFTEVLQAEEEIKFESVLEELEDWDSLSKMATIAFFDKDFSVKLTINDFKNMQTVEDLAKKAGL